MTDIENIERIMKDVITNLEGEMADVAMSGLVFSLIVIAEDSGVTLEEVHEAIDHASEQMAKSGRGAAWA